MLEIALIVCILVGDQVTKYLSELYLSPLGTSFPLIPGVLCFQSAHNTGAAWSLFEGQRWLFLVLTAAVVVALVYTLVRYRGQYSRFSRILMAMLIAGAVGNAVDRLLLGYVRDMIYFELINFPVFNVADISLTVGCGMLAVDTLFFKDRSMLDVVERNTKKPKVAAPAGEPAKVQDAPAGEPAAEAQAPDGDAEAAAPVEAADGPASDAPNVSDLSQTNADGNA